MELDLGIITTLDFIWGVDFSCNWRCDFYFFKRKKEEMKLGEFIKNFSHNNVIRLVYKIQGGHEVVLGDWNKVSMDHQVIKGTGHFRHYIENEVLGLSTVQNNLEKY